MLQTLPSIKLEEIGKRQVNLASINRAMGAIEFSMDGKVTKVNENFANLTGYSEKEIVGNHHSMFVEATYKSSAEYKAFWDKLNRR